MPNVLDNYVTSPPTHQNALAIFAGQWTSLLPGAYRELKAGSIPLFEDGRVVWAIEQLGGVLDQEILELGPLEGGHSYMLDRAGANVLAVESNTSAFLRCLVMKEILGMPKVRFRCGDFRALLASTDRMYDVIFASGVLYHMMDPVRLLYDICSRCHKLYLWTHYYDADLVKRNEIVRRRLGPALHQEFKGLRYEAHSYNYEITLEWSGFCGGSAPTCLWLTRDSILNALGHFGFRIVGIAYEEPDHPHGPCFAIVAKHDRVSQ